MRTTNKTHAASHTSDAGPRSFDAYHRTRAEREAIAREDVALMNVDLTEAATIVYGALPSIVAMRPQLAKLDGFRIAAVDRLEDYALAAELANARFTLDTPTPDGLEPLAAEATAARDRLLAIARGLAAWNVLDAKSVAAIAPSSGYRPLGDQLVTLAQLFRAHRDAIRDRSPVTDDDVARAATVGEKLLATVGLRDHAAGEVTDAALDRRRAFTLLDRAYDEVRRGISYLRWNEGDLETFAPSLHGHGNAPHKPKPAAGTEATPPVPAAPARAVDAPAMRSASNGPDSSPFTE